MPAKFLNNKKNLLVLGTLLLLVASYRFAISKTVAAWHLNTELTLQTESGSLITEQASYVVRKERNLEKILGTYKVDTLELRNNIISKIAEIAAAENIHLAEVPQKDASSAGGGILVQKLTFEGDYKSLLRLLNKIENHDKLGIVRSFKITKPGLVNPGKIHLLLCEIYFEMLGK